MDYQGKNLYTGRLLLLTKIILTFLVITILIFLNYLDLKETNENIGYLHLLKDAYKKTTGSDLVFSNYELNRLEWMRMHDSSTYQNHYKSRTSLVAVLSQFGASIDDETKGSHGSPNHFILMTDLKNNYIGQNAFKTFEEGHIKKNLFLNPEANITEALDSFKRNSIHIEGQLLISIDSAALRNELGEHLKESKRLEWAQKTTIASMLPPQIPKSIPVSPSSGLRTQTLYTDSVIVPLTLKPPVIKKTRPNKIVLSRSAVRDTLQPVDKGTGGLATSSAHSDAPQFFGIYYDFLGVYAKTDTIYIFMESKDKTNIDNSLMFFYTNPIVNASGGQGGSLNEKRKIQYIQFPVKTVSIEFPPNFFFMQVDTNAILELANNDSKQTELKNLYGGYELSVVDNLATEAFNKNNNAISILGFDVSRKWFPIAMMIVLLVVNFLILNTIQTAKKSKTEIMSIIESDDALGFLIHNTYIRFLMWVISPLCLFSLIIYSSLIHYSPFLYGILASSCFLSVSLGFLANRRIASE